jgi:hypothetical protein
MNRGDGAFTGQVEPLDLEHLLVKDLRNSHDQSGTRYRSDLKAPGHHNSSPLVLKKPGQKEIPPERLLWRDS